MYDQGSSLSQQDMEQLTQRFWRKGYAVGTGLGLSIVQAIVQYAGGALRLCSQAQGLCISLEFPLNTLSTSAP